MEPKGGSWLVKWKWTKLTEEKTKKGELFLSTLYERKAETRAGKFWDYAFLPGGTESFRQNFYFRMPAQIHDNIMM